MTPLEAARRLAAHDPVADHDSGYGCQFCSGPADLAYGGEWQINHEPDCPWRAMPRIVAVMEAAEWLGDWGHEPENDYGVYMFCGAPAALGGHALACRWQALVAAMGERGDGATNESKAIPA